MPHSMTQKVNTFAERAFRDTADKDYIHARMAYRANLFPQFHWSSLHALEKYAKCILILARVPRPKRPIGHEVQRSLELIRPHIDIELSAQTKAFIKRLEEFGARFRYLEFSWCIYDVELAQLDRAVWELRRYCNAALYTFSESGSAAMKSVNCQELRSIEKPNQKNTFIGGGFLEKTLENRKSQTRPYLVWCNLYYSTSKRTRVLIRSIMAAENAPFFLYPEIIDDVAKYTLVTKEVRKAYLDSSHFIADDKPRIPQKLKR